MTLTEEESLSRKQLLEMYLELLEEVEDLRERENSCGGALDSFDYNSGYDDGYDEGYSQGRYDMKQEMKGDKND